MQRRALWSDSTLRAWGWSHVYRFLDRCDLWWTLWVQGVPLCHLGYKVYPHLARFGYPRCVRRTRRSDTADARREASRRRSSDQRREAIVDAALAAIEEDGPQALTGAIAERAGLARTHIYRHFASKEELDLAVARRAHRDLIELIRSNLDVDGTPLDVIRAPLAQHVCWAVEHPNLYGFLIGRDYRRDTHQPELGESPLAAELTAAAARYVPLFEVDRSAADRVVVAIMGLVDASLSWWLQHPDTGQDALVDRLAMQIWLIADHGLREIGINLEPFQQLPSPAAIETFAAVRSRTSAILPAPTSTP